MRSTTISLTVLSLLTLAMASPEAATISKQAKVPVSPQVRLTKIDQMKADIASNKAKVVYTGKHIKNLQDDSAEILSSKKTVTTAQINKVDVNIDRIKGKTAALGRQQNLVKTGTKSLTATLKKVSTTNSTMIKNESAVSSNFKHIAELNAANTKLLSKPLTKTSIAQLQKNTKSIIGKTAAIQRESDAAGVASKQLKTLLSKRAASDTSTSLKASIKKNTLDVGYNAKHIAELHAENAAILLKPITTASRAKLIKNQTSINGKTTAMKKESKKAAALKKVLKTLNVTKKKSSTATAGAGKSKSTKATSKKQKVPAAKVAKVVAATPSSV